jgi:hypothetical protein
MAQGLSSIPRLFKATDFGIRQRPRSAGIKPDGHFGSLEGSVGALEGSHHYTTALLEAIKTLREIYRRYHVGRALSTGGKEK